jgi:hypothetical protein
MTTVGTFALDGNFTDWTTANEIDTPGNAVAGYKVFGSLVTDTTLGKNYVIGIDATATSDPVIAAGTTIYLNTDQNRSTGYSPSGNVGAEYYINFVSVGGVVQPYLYAGGTNALISATPLNFGFSTDHKSVEVAVPQALLTPAGGVAPKSINLVAAINNSVFLPGDYASNPQYVVTDPSTLVTVNHAIKKVGIVWSETTANKYFSKTAYSDLFMAAQHQAEAAGVSYDLLTEADLTNVSKLAQYSALVFPSMANVQSSQAAAIASALGQVVYNYHVPIITAGDFMTNDQTGAPLPGNSYATMQALLDLHPTAFGTATYSLTPTDLANSIMKGYTAGQLIGGASGQFVGTTAGYYTNTGYGTYSGVSKPADVLASINIQGGATVAGVVETTTGGNNVHFATTGLLGDSNLLQHAIQGVVFGTAPALALQSTRMAGIVASRTDMDQSQFIDDVAPFDANDNPLPGIYDKLLPLLAQWKSQYNFVGSFFISVGDGNTDFNTGTDWLTTGAYYKQIIALGSEIGNHSYTHLITPPTSDPNGNAIPVGANGVSLWNENTNYLYTTGTAADPNWTFNYEFGQSKLIEQQNLGIIIAGAAVPGAGETFETAQKIAAFYQSVAGGLTGYISGGWTGVGSGAPNAFGYLSPSDQGSVYIAPNITFDFSEVQFQGKTPAQALADWKALFGQLSANSDVPVIVWPWHDYGATAWDTSGTGAGSPYTAQMFADFIAYAYSKNYEFVTEETLAARIVAQQKATISETTVGNVITATVTPDASAPDLGGMALGIINGATGQVIQNAGSWYAYDTSNLFLPRNGGTFTVTLGTAQDDVTHISSLPMRADLLSVTGNGSNINFSIAGDGIVGLHVKTPGTQIISIQGAQAATLAGTNLNLTFNDGPLAVSATSPQGTPVQHNVTITEGAAPIITTGTNILFGGSGTNKLDLTGLIENYTLTTLSTTSEKLVDTRAGTPNGTDIVTGFQAFNFSDGLSLSLAQMQGTGVTRGTAAANTITSNSAGQVILGLAGNDRLTAGANNQVLDGGSGNDTLLDGGRSGITLIGGPGNETFVVSNAATKIIQALSSGINTIQTTLASYILPTNVTNLVLTNAAAAQTATSTAANETFTASAFHRDTFVFGVGFGKDTITNFRATTAATHDNLNLSSSLFAAGTTVGALLNGTARNASNGLVTLTQSGANVVLGVDANNSITLSNILLSTFTASAQTDVRIV